jgi:hypothetical protein
VAVAIAFGLLATLLAMIGFVFENNRGYYAH